MIEVVRKYIDQNQLLTKKELVIVGISGGADSAALLHMLVSMGYQCIAAHCNFKLRGEESDRDELFTDNYTHILQVPLRTIVFETKQYALNNHLSIEMAARELRYAWFEELRKEYNAQAIAVAHHRDDSIETLLINLTRGSGLCGLTGIRPRNGYVVRPLLPLSREDVFSYIDSNKLSYVTDSTNSSDIYTRNFIRLKVLPLLAQINPSIKASLARTADHLGEAEIIFKHVIYEARNKVIQDNSLSIDALMEFPAPKTILFELLKPYGFTRVVTEDIFSSLEKDSGKLFYSDSYRLLKDRSFLLIDSLEKHEQQCFTLDNVEGHITVPIELIFSKLVINKDFLIERNLNFAYFDYDKLKFPLTLRHWKEGDWFVPFGMTGRKKLSDYFSNNKFSLFDKEKIWLLCNGEDIIWIVGERPDNRYRIDKSTKKVLKVNFLDKKGFTCKTI
ncbi:MAG: tRNA lysidine(34) synthetase TilS [Tannerellaceae bacterium]|nr:tRNA lysidine(34) synthetase TilS [Tannerellaceae bacterium]